MRDVSDFLWGIKTDRVAFYDTKAPGLPNARELDTL